MSGGGWWPNPGRPNPLASAITTDGGRAGWENVKSFVRDAIGNAPADAVEAAKSIPTGLWNLVRHPVQTVKNTLDLGAAGLATATGQFDPDEFPANPKDPVDTNARMLLRNLGTPAAARNTIAKHPVQAALLASSVLRGGAGLSKFAGAADAATALERAGDVLDPVSSAVSLAAKAPGVRQAVAAARRAKARSIPAVSEDGALTPPAQAAIGASRVNPALVDPALQERYAAEAADLGNDPAVANQALLKQTGVEAPTKSMVTGARPPKGLDPRVSVPTRADALRQVDEHASSIAPDVSEPVIGQSFINNRIASRNAVKQAYDRAYSHDIVIDPEVVDSVEPTLESTLRSDKYPHLPDDLGSLQDAGVYPQTALVLKGRGGPGGYDGLLDRFRNFADNGGASLRDLGDVNTFLNNHWIKATGQDAQAIDALRDGVNRWADEMVADPDKIVMGAEDAPQALADIRAARQAFINDKNTFMPASSPGVRAATARLDKDLREGPDGWTVEGAQASLPTEIEAHLTNGLFDSKKGAALGPKGTNATLHERLLGDASPLTDEGKQGVVDYIAHRALNRPMGSAEAEAFAQTPYGQLLDPDTLMAVRQHAAARDILTAKDLVSDEPSKLAQLGKDLGSGALAAGASALVEHGLGIPTGPLIDIGAPIAAAAGEHILGPMLKSGVRTRAELAGAPGAMADVDLGAATNPVATAGLVSNIAGSGTPEQGAPSAPAAPVVTVAPDDFATMAPPAEPAAEGEHKDEQSGSGVITVAPDDFATMAPPADDRPQRASGGKVGGKDIEPLINALMRKAQKAKTGHAKATEPLLNVHDNAIASALRVAQAAS